MQAQWSEGLTTSLNLSQNLQLRHQSHIITKPKLNMQCQASGEPCNRNTLPMPMKTKDAELAHWKIGFCCLTSAWTISATPSSAFQIPSIRFRCRLSLFSIEPSTLRLYRGPSVTATASPAAALALDCCVPHFTSAPIIDSSPITW